jgi:hypothetical protein
MTPNTEPSMDEHLSAYHTCCTLSILSSIPSIVYILGVGALVLFLVGDQVYQVAGWTIYGSWLAIPASCLAALSLLLVYPVMLRSK